MEYYIVDEIWQLALAYEVRLNYHLRDLEKHSRFDSSELAKPKSLPEKMRGEFNEEYGKNHVYALLTDDEKGIATLRIVPYDETTCKIERVAVREERQGEGLGSKLIAFAEEKIQEKGYSDILIYSYEGALNFYLQNGYQIDDTIQIDDDVNQVAVRKKL